MLAEENKEKVRCLLEEAYGEGKVEVVHAMRADGSKEWRRMSDPARVFPTGGHGRRH